MRQNMETDMHSVSSPLWLIGILMMSPPASAQPNVVIVITDDQGYGDLSCHGNPNVKTPNMDRLHSQSVRLTDYHVNPTCAPTRAALLTGRNANRVGVWHTINGRSILREGEVVLAVPFANAGYATAMFGKWHLGDNYPSRAEDRGFSEVLRHGGGGVGQTPDFWDNAYFDGAYLHNGKPEPAKGFCTDVFFDAAQTFIRAQAKAKRPFLVYLAPNAPHGPMNSPEEYAAPYAALPTHIAHFFGMIANIDANLGRLMNLLDAEGLAKDTILIFTTDNGTSSGHKVFNAGMRGSKGTEYDGGHRVPFFIRWPGGNIGGGRDVNQLAAHVDVFPTLLDLCGIRAPEGVRFDGASIASWLRGGEDGPPSDRILITDSQRIHTPLKWKQSAAMSGKWRLVNGRELYDIGSDPGQKIDVAAQNPAVFERLKAAYELQWAGIEPTFADTQEIVIGNDAENPARLTCHDWLLRDEEGNAPWNQASIRAIKDAPVGRWRIRADRPGRYRITLRRWPAEANLPIAANSPAGQPVPGEMAFRTTPGRGFPATRARINILDQTRELGVPANAPAVTFELPLEAREGTLRATFIDPDGKALDAYFVEIQRL